MTATSPPIVPGPLHFDVYQSDVDAVSKMVIARRYGVVRPWMLAFGLAYVAFGIYVCAQNTPSYGLHHPSLWWPIAFGLSCSWMAFRTRAPLTFRLPRDMRFFADGFALDELFSSAKPRRYSWWTIKAIEDFGDALVIFPRFDRGIVMPKRDFPDDGREVWQFFTAHGVAGRVPPSVVMA